MEENIAIFETAFVTADFRAMDTLLSKDVHAHLWPTPRTKEYRKDYVTQVSAHEPFAHCLRNRFFLDYIARLTTDQGLDMLINFGCGFSMYPFLLPKTLEHIEIDMPNAIAFKKERIAHWQKTGVLPQRKITFLEADFNTDYAAELKAKILGIKGTKRCFILLEGVLFFIDRTDTDVLFELFGQLQQEGDYLGSVSFPKEVEKSPAFKKLAAFALQRLDANAKFEYQTVEDYFYSTLDGYRLMEHEHTISLAALYVPEHSLKEAEVLNEHMYILKKE